MLSVSPRPGVALRVITQASVAVPGAEVKAASGYDGLTKQSGMISLDLPTGTVEAPPGGVGDSHVTVIFLGDALTPEDFDQACDRAQDAASRIPGPLTVSLSGIAAFPPNENGKKAVYVPASVPGGDRLHNDLSDLSASQFKTWIPHATSHFDDADAPMPPPHPHKVVTVTHLSVHRGDEVRRFPFGGVPQDRKDMDEPDGLETKVGPHGWSHNWVYHGIPGVGDEVHHPGHGKGKVTSVTDKHVTVQFASGANRTFEHSKPPAGGKTGFVTRAEHESGQRAAGRAAAASAAGAPHAAAMAKAKQVHEAEKARGAGHLHPLAKTGPATTDAKGTTRSTAVDHEGREFRLKANGNKVTVKHGDRSMSSSEASNPSLKAREMAGKLAGAGAAPKAKEPDAGKPLAPGLSQSYVTGKGATDADVAELARRYVIMHGKDPSAKQLAGIKRAKTETAKPAASKPMPHHAATAHAIADDVRTERGLNGFQREEATTRLRSAGRNLSAGNHGEAVTDLDDATAAAGTPGGGVIKGSVAARSRDLAGQVRADAGTSANPAGTAPVDAAALHDAAGIATGPHPADRLTVASNPKATAKAMSTDELQAADAELGRRAALLGKPGQVSTLHKAVRGELASRLSKGKPAKVKAERKSLPSEGVTEVSQLLASATGREPAVRNHLSVATAALDHGDAKTAYGALDLARRYATGEFGDNPERPVLLADKTEAWRSITQLRDSLRAAARNAE